jgi:hypothetical protein
MTTAFHWLSAFLHHSSIRDSLLVFRQTSHARTPTAAPPKCAADETELIPAFLLKSANDLEPDLMVVPIPPEGNFKIP